MKMKTKAITNAQNLAFPLNLKRESLKKSSNSNKEDSKLLAFSPLQRGINYKHKGKFQAVSFQNASAKEKRDKSFNNLAKQPHKICVNPVKESKNPNQHQEDKLNTLSSQCSINCNNNLTNTIYINDNNPKELKEEHVSENNHTNFKTPKCKPTQADSKISHSYKASSSETRNRQLKRNHYSLPYFPTFSQSDIPSYASLIEILTKGLDELNTPHKDLKEKEKTHKKKFDLFMNALNRLSDLSVDASQRELIKIIIDGLSEICFEEKKEDNTRNETIQKNDLKSSHTTSNTIASPSTYTDLTYIKKTIPKFNFQAKDNSSPCNHQEKIEVIKAKDSVRNRQSDSTNNEESNSIDLDSLYFNDRMENLTHSVSYSHIPKLNLEHCLSNCNDNNCVHRNNKKKKKRSISKSTTNPNKNCDLAKLNKRQSFSLIKIEKCN